MAVKMRVTKVKIKGAAAKNPKFTPIGMATRFGAKGRSAVRTAGGKGRVGTGAAKARSASNPN
jgi:hypothetical protein